MLAKQLQKHAVNRVVLQRQLHEDGQFLLLANQQLENPNGSLLVEVSIF